jgi:TP901 family phage tail tape measure protein
MADVNATFNYDANFGSTISQIKALSKELSVLNNSFNSLDKNARVLRNDIANTFTGAVGQIGGFSAKTVAITSDLDNFGKSLDKSKLKLRDYYREATRAFSANSNARKLAEDQVRRTKGQLVELGVDGQGARKGILVTPLKLDMTDMQNQLQVARKQFDIFNRLVQDGATHLVNWGKNTQWAGRQLTVGLTVPMTMFATTTIKAFNDVDRELTRFQKVYGSDLVSSTKQATNEMRQQIQALSVDFAKKYGIAAKETAALAADLAATGLEGEKLIGSLKQTSRLAVLGEVDRQEAMKATLALQSSFKMNTDELAESINFLNAVENQTSTSLTDLTEAIPRVGPVINALGGDVKDLSVLLVAMKEGGISAAEGANAIKSGMASLINPTKQATTSAKQYGIDLEGIVKANKGQLMPTIMAFQQQLSVLDDFAKAQIIEQIFGKYQFARMSALFDNLNANGSQTVKVLELMGQSSEDLAKIADGEIKTLTESTSMRFQRAMEGIKASMLPIGETITRSIIPYLEKFSNFLDKVVEAGKNLPEPVKNFLKFGAGITAVAGPLVMITGVLANFLGYVTKGAMGFVNLGRRLVGLPTKQFSLLDDEQIAAAKATDILTVSIQNQATAMTRLVQLMRDYNSTLIAQRAATPGAFSNTPLVSTGKGAKTPPIRRQKGSWVPGSGSGDKVKALLEPGEFVVNRNAAKQYGGVLEDMNNGTPRFQNGGILRAQEGTDTSRQSSRRPLVYQDLESSAARSHLIDPAKLYDLIMSDPDLSDLKPFLNSEKKKAAMSAYGYSTSMLDMQYVNNALNQIGSSAGSASMPVTISGVDETIGLFREKLSSESISPNSRVMLEESLKHFEGIKKRHKNDVSYQRFLARQIAVSNVATGTGLSDSINDEYERIYRAIEGSTSPEDLQKRLLLLEKERIKQLGAGRGRALQSYDSEAEKKVIARKGLRGRKVNDFFKLIKVYGGAEERYNIPSERRRQAAGVRAPGLAIPRRRAGFQRVPNVGTMAGMQSGGGFGAARTRKRLSKQDRNDKFRLMDQWIWDSKNVREDPERFEKMKSLLGPSQSGFGATRGTVLGSPGNKELPYTQQLKVVKALKDGRYEDIYGMKLNFKGPSSYTANRGMDMSPFIGRSNPLLSSISRNYIQDQSYTESLKRLRAGRFKARKQKLVEGTPEYNHLLAQSGWSMGLAAGSPIKTFEGVIDYYKRAQTKNRRQLKNMIPDDVFQQLLIQESVGSGTNSLNLQSAFGSKKPQMRHSNARLKAEQEILLGNRQSKITGVASDVKTKLPVLVTESGMQRKQSGGPAWVPGMGDGDRVPALLEPGEFVVNKKAAKKYGGLLHDINFNQAPRFAKGGGKSSFDKQKIATNNTVDNELPELPELVETQSSSERQSSGMSRNQRISAGTGSVGMMAMMLPAISPTNEALAKFGTTVSTAMFAVSALSGVMDMFGKKLNAQSMAGFFEGGTAKRGAGKQGLRVGAKMGGVRGAGIAAQGAGRLAMGALMSGPGLAFAATVGVIALAVKSYRDQIEQSRKASQEAFSAGAKTAEAFGYEVQSLNDKLKENQKISKDLGIYKENLTAVSTLSEEQKGAIKEDNKNLIGKLNNSAGEKYFTGNVVSKEQSQSMLIAKYASLRQQGFTAEDANQVLTEIATQAGDETLSALSFIRPQLSKITGETAKEIFESTQQAQIDSLKSLTIDSSAGSSEGFRDAFKGIMNSLQYAAPQDQLEALNTVIKSMDSLDAEQMVQAGKAIKEMADATYGSDSTMAKTIEAMVNAGDVKGAAKLDTAAKFGFDQERLMEITADFVVTPEEQAELDKFLQDRQIAIDLQVRNEEQATKIIDDTTASIQKEQDAYSNFMTKMDDAADAESERYKAAQKAHQAYIKQRQKEISAIQKTTEKTIEGKRKEIEAINETTDALLKSLEGNKALNDFQNQQRASALGGLEALAGGDVFGYLQSQQEMQGNADQFGAAQEIESINDQRESANKLLQDEIDRTQELADKRIENLEGEIEKRQELAESEDERHEKRMASIEKERESYSKAHAQRVTELNAIVTTAESMKSKSGEAYKKLVGNLGNVTTETQKAQAANIVLQEIAKGTPYADAIKAGEKYLKDTVTVAQNANSKEGRVPVQDPYAVATGGYISGPGTGTSDSIAARLSNGEYVIKASSVQKYGKSMLDQINSGNIDTFADGGLATLDKSYRGKLDSSTKSKIIKAQQSWGQQFDLVKGGYLPGGGLSQQTHTGGGVFDAYYNRGNSFFPKAAIQALEAVGIRAWNRDMPYTDSSGYHPNKHIHAVEKGNPNLSSQAAGQVGDAGNTLYDGANGMIEQVSASMKKMVEDRFLDTDVSKKIYATNSVVEGLKEQAKRTAQMGIETLSNGIKTTLHKGEMVLSRPLSESLKTGIEQLSYNMPERDSATPSGAIINNASSYQININAGNISDPSKLAKMVVNEIRSQEDRRNFSRSYNG